MKKVLLCILLPSLVCANDQAVLCAACHGPLGNSTNALWPNLAGQNEKYLLRQLKAYKLGSNGGRFNPTMTPLMANLTERDLAELAAYYASLPANVSKPSTLAIDAGKALYRTNCIACHGPQGLGNPAAGFPRLAGQQVDYTIAALEAYKKGERHHDFYSRIMTTLAKRMDDDVIKSVAYYLQGLE